MHTSPPATPDPADHQGPSDYEGWDPTPDPVGELDVAGDGGSRETGGSGPGIAFIPGDPSTAAGTPDANERTVPESDEVTALRERLAFYESFDTLIRDNIDRAGALLREVATKQADAEVKLRSTTKEFEARQIAERSGYRTIFATLLDEVSTIQQQVERLATRVSDALDDLELELPAAGELAAIERGQAPGMTGIAISAVQSGLPSGASSAAWVTHDVDLPATTGKHATAPTHHAPVDDEGQPTTESPVGLVGDSAPATEEEAAEQVDPEVVEDVLTEGTDADPAVADPTDDLPGGVALPTDLSDLPEEFGLDNPAAPGSSGVIDGPYVERSEASDVEVQDAHLTSAESEGFYVDASPELDELVGFDEDLQGDDTPGQVERNDREGGRTPLMAAAPIDVTEHDGGLDATPKVAVASMMDESPAVDDVPGVGVVADVMAAEVPSTNPPEATYGADAPLETGLGSDPRATHNRSGPAGGLGEPPSKLRRFEAEPPRPTWGSVAPAPRGAAHRTASSTA